MLVKLLAVKESWLKREDGATAVEYALIATGVALALVATFFAFGDELGGLFDTMTGRASGE